MNEYYYATGEDFNGNLIMLESEDNPFVNFYLNDIDTEAPFNFLKIFLTYCRDVLRENDGGHLDIFNEDDNYIINIEV